MLKILWQKLSESGRKNKWKIDEGELGMRVMVDSLR